MHSKCCFSLQLYSPLALFRQCNLPPCGKIGYIVWNDTTNVFDHAYLCFILFVLHVCLIRCFTIFHFYHTSYLYTKIYYVPISINMQLLLLSAVLYCQQWLHQRFMPIIAFPFFPP
jgi:hypothetical protein